MNNQLAFDLDKGMRLQEHGLSLVESHDEGWLSKARDAARAIATFNGTVTSDEVLKVVGYPPDWQSPNVIGAIFKSKGFVHTGEFVRTERPEGRGRMIRVWGWEGAD